MEKEIIVISYIYSVIIITCSIRALSFFISKKRGDALLKEGGIEYDKITTNFLVYTHLIYYCGSAVEAILKIDKFSIDWVNFLGIALYLFSLIVLYYVQKILGKYWSIKLIKIKGQKAVEHWLFQKFRHPNYFLNIIPELIGITLMLKAYITFFIVFPIYLVILYYRIKHEEELFKEEYKVYEKRRKK